MRLPETTAVEKIADSSEITLGDGLADGSESTAIDEIANKSAGEKNTDGSTNTLAEIAFGCGYAAGMQNTDSSGINASNGIAIGSKILLVRRIVMAVKEQVAVLARNDGNASGEGTDGSESTAWW